MPQKVVAYNILHFDRTACILTVHILKSIRVSHHGSMNLVLVWIITAEKQNFSTTSVKLCNVKPKNLFCRTV